MAFSMAAAAEALEARLRANRLLALPAEWAGELIYPYYNGLSLVNVPGTAAQLLGAEIPGGIPLDEAVWGGESLAGIRRVLIFLTDGLGYLRLRETMAADPQLTQTVSDLTDGRGPVPLTSITPSTTVAALTTLWTGRAPAAHGVMGIRLFLREVGLLTFVLGYRPAVGVHPEGILAQWGLDPRRFVTVPALAEVLAAASVPTHLLLPSTLMDTGLSQLLHRGVEHRHVHMGYTDFWPRLHDVLAATAGQKCCVSVYWPAVDTISHAYGARSRYSAIEINKQLAELRDVLASSAVRDGHTLVLILADHGQHDAPEEIRLDAHPAARTIYDAQRVGFGGENRLPILYLRDGKKQAVIDALAEHFPDRVTWVDSATALQAGLFGPPPFHSEAEHRAGELILIPRLNTLVTDGMLRFDIRGWHGGLADWEMLIPLLWKRV